MPDTRRWCEVDEMLFLEEIHRVQGIFLVPVQAIDGGTAAAHKGEIRAGPVQYLLDAHDFLVCMKDQRFEIVPHVVDKMHRGMKVAEENLFQVVNRQVRIENEVPVCPGCGNPYVGIDQENPVGETEVEIGEQFTAAVRIGAAVFEKVWDIGSQLCGKREQFFP